ncbi:gamma carbonic anhydrase family protein [Halomonas sp. McH1-25]|uniref:gamma carbonic anhydrase family protein n=1 Tax=unclassified Halomonas TaxID=2609666 RepID=UPI001EF401F2|nr:MULTISPECIES: gamma carbonic anhydrase family protein [unclassified Halomonas]MCG7601086.1 gamma carbonic anhydrase family protein [Halomonas sp. McH1-25]MCP1342956.1 gamma carbonic anhydrase family protein [Halomonas sp. FL8]MCP1360808.1 gamma carbonic anhydrase family protein [Halomonas sp. BBD45]MCP1364104.1 gamma carbonic anhydrase family protein [Halomonas sp. BBD48]
MALYALGELSPELLPGAYTAPEAVLIGDVKLEENASVWPGAVLRGDNEPIKVGKGSNIQENCVLHTDPGFPIHIGDNVTVGHLVMLHGCTIGNGSLVGMHATVLNGATIGENCLIGAGAVITANKEFPPNSLILGAPAKVVRTLSEEEIAGLVQSSESYVARKERYNNELRRLDDASV